MTHPTFLAKLSHQFSRKSVQFLLVNLGLIGFQLVYITLRYTVLSDTLPIFYTHPWGDSQFGPKILLYQIPLFLTLTLILALFLYKKAKTLSLRYAEHLIFVVFTLANVLLTVSLLRIVQIALITDAPLLEPKYISLVPAFLLTLVITLVATPQFIKLFTRYGLVTNPKVHNHPGMSLDKPSARGGGAVFALIFVGAGLVLVGVSKLFFAIYLGAVLLAALGVVDDWQNTNVLSKFRLLETPLLRLMLLCLVVGIVVFSGIRIETIGNPAGGLIDFTIVPLLPELFTILWIVWILNLLSWSNGVDGQYGGIVGITFVVIAVLALRFDPLKSIHTQIATLAVVASAVSWGITKYNWYPSKIMWGFGAMAAGIVMTSTSIVIGSKVATSTIVILIPFMDAMVIIVRRILQGKNPLRGDKGHLHHILHARGWGFRRIAVFYWLTTALFGLIVIVAAERVLPLVMLTLAGFVAFGILALNYSAGLLKRSRDKKSIDSLI